MKIFKAVRNHLKSIGFNENQPSFNMQQLDLSVKTILGLILVCVHISYVADTPNEVMDGIFMVTVGILVLIARISTVFKMKTIFDLINRFQAIINHSKFSIIEYKHFYKSSTKNVEKNILGSKYPVPKKMYKKTNRTVEKLCKIVYLVIVKVPVPALILPKAFACFFIYLTTDAGPNAFELPFPVW